VADRGSEGRPGEGRPRRDRIGRSSAGTRELIEGLRADGYVVLRDLDLDDDAFVELTGGLSEEVGEVERESTSSGEPMSAWYSAIRSLERTHALWLPSPELNPT